MTEEILMTVDERSGDVWFDGHHADGRIKTPAILLPNAINSWIYTNPALTKIYCPISAFINCGDDPSLVFIHAPLMNSLYSPRCHLLARIGFPLVETLMSDDCPNLEEIDCPKLKKLTVQRCPKLWKIKAVAGLSIPNFSPTPEDPTVYLRNP